MTEDRAAPGITLVALLYLHPGKTVELERFEAAASRIMARYGGRIERRIHPEVDAAAPHSTKISPPDEVHVVRFPDAASLARYRADDELAALAELRAAAIRETVVWQAVEAPLFSDE